MLLGGDMPPEKFVPLRLNLETVSIKDHGGLATSLD